jgi:hypothetical protein
MHPGVAFPCGGEQAARKIIELLSERGLHVVRSFDLHAATDGVCDCPYHGTDRCTCQYVVLLVYGATGAPAVVTAHSRDAISHLELVTDANVSPNPGLVSQILEALADARGTFPDLPCSPLSEAEAGAA